MAVCINKGLSEYQSLKNMAGISEPALDFWCLYYLTKFNRFPYLDELPNVDSSKNLLETMKAKLLKSTYIADISTLQEVTGIESFPEAIIKLNNIYRDLEITGCNLNSGKFFIDIKHRPTVIKQHTEYEDNYNKTIANNRTVLVNSLLKLQKYYGINIIPVDSSNFESEEFKDLPIQAQNAKAFVYNGHIYVNTDYAGIESPIHELLHIFLGGMRYTNPGLYMELLSKVQNLNLDVLALKFGVKTELDLLEEYFVTEFAKFLCGLPSPMSNLPEQDIQFILYNITRNLDSVLMGETTVKVLPAEDIVKGSLLDLAQKTKSEIIKEVEITPLDAAVLHRKTANIKSKLLESGDLVQNCF